MTLLQETLFAPLAALRSNFDPSNDAGVWWATPEAVSVWGQAGIHELPVLRFPSDMDKAV